MDQASQVLKASETESVGIQDVRGQDAVGEELPVVLEGAVAGRAQWVAKEALQGEQQTLSRTDLKLLNEQRSQRPIL